MLKKISIEDKDEYLKLGTILHDNFDNLFKLEEDLKKDYTRIYGYYKDNKLIGFIHIQISFDEADLVNIVVNNDYRCMGIGSKLIDYAIKDNNIKKITLEVRIDNPAVKFYQDNKFIIIRTIKKYYEDNDAYLMQKVIK